MIKENKFGIYNLTIMRGVLIGLLILFFISALTAILDTYIYTLDQQILNLILIIVNTLILLVIGIYIASKVERNGWLNGGLGGLIYMGIIILLGALSMGISLGSVFLLLLIGLVIGSLGGIIGINI